MRVLFTRKWRCLRSGIRVRHYVKCPSSRMMIRSCNSWAIIATFVLVVVAGSGGAVGSQGCAPISDADSGGKLVRSSQTPTSWPLTINLQSFLFRRLYLRSGWDAAGVARAFRRRQGLDLVSHGEVGSAQTGSVNILRGGYRKSEIIKHYILVMTPRPSNEADGEVNPRTSAADAKCSPAAFQFAKHPKISDVRRCYARQLQRLTRYYRPAKKLQRRPRPPPASRRAQLGSRVRIPKLHMRAAPWPWSIPPDNTHASG